MEQDIGLIQ